MRDESPESYLRRFAEGQLRRLAAGEAAAAECASRVDAVAAAFEGTGVLDAERAEAVTGDLSIALAARSPDGLLLHAGRRGQISVLRATTGFARIFARASQMRARGIATGGGPEDASGDGPARPAVFPWPYLPSQPAPTGHPGSPSQPAPAHSASPTNLPRPTTRPAVSVVPTGAVLRLREDGADEDIYLLSYVTTPGRAWVSVAARTDEPRVPRRHASPPSGRNAGAQRARRSTFAGGALTAVDDAGRTYELHFSGGGGHWYLGRLSLHPAPPPGIAWLEVRCGGQSARLDLTATGSDAEVTVRPIAAGPAEAYLLRHAEGLLGHAGAADGLARLVTAEVTGLASAVPALRAIGMLPDDSSVPGQLAALAERMGVPGRAIAEPGGLPERWAGVLDAGGSPAASGAGRPITVGAGGAFAASGWGAATAGPGNAGAGGTGTGSTADADEVAAAHMAVVLPEVSGVSLQLAGMVTLPGEGTVIFGGLRVRDTGQAGDGEQSMWLRDDDGWHAVSVSGWSSSGGSHSFQATVVPPVGPEISRAEFYVTGWATEVKAVIPLTWWTPQAAPGAASPGEDGNP